jgi:hypothetical protein
MGRYPHSAAQPSCTGRRCFSYDGDPLRIDRYFGPHHNSTLGIYCAGTITAFSGSKPAFSGTVTNTDDEHTGALACDSQTQFTFTDLGSEIAMAIVSPPAAGKLTKWNIAADGEYEY